MVQKYKYHHHIIHFLRRLYPPLMVNVGLRPQVWVGKLRRLQLQLEGPRGALSPLLRRPSSRLSGRQGGQAQRWQGHHVRETDRRASRRSASDSPAPLSTPDVHRRLRAQSARPNFGRKFSQDALDFPPSMRNGNAWNQSIDQSIMMVIIMSRTRRSGIQ